MRNLREKWKYEASTLGHWSSTTEAKNKNKTNLQHYHFMISVNNTTADCLLNWIIFLTLTTPKVLSKDKGSNCVGKCISSYCKISKSSGKKKK
jgi:hypothetical protein